MSLHATDATTCLRRFLKKPWPATLLAAVLVTALAAATPQALRRSALSPVGPDTPFAPDAIAAIRSLLNQSTDCTGIDCVTIHFYEEILGRTPSQGETDDWGIGYFLWMVSQDVDLRFVPSEMGRQFFLSVALQVESSGCRKL